MADDMSTAKEVYEATQAVCAAKLELNHASYVVGDAEKLRAGTIEHIAKLDIVIAGKFEGVHKTDIAQVRKHAGNDLLSATARKLEQELQLCRAIATKTAYVTQLAAAELYLTRVTDQYYEKEGVPAYDSTR